MAIKKVDPRTQTQIQADQNVATLASVPPDPNAAIAAATSPSPTPSDAPAIPPILMSAIAPKSLDITPQTPSLAPQGSSNKFLNALERVVGVTADTPAPGQMYTGPTTEGGKIHAIEHFAGAIGNALAASSGTPEQEQLAEQRSEFAPKLQAEQNLAQAQLHSLDAYRRGELTNVANKNDIAQMKASDQMRLKGYVEDPNSPGAYRPMTEDEILADPILSRNRDIASAALISKNAQAELAKAHADAITNPNNPLFQQKERQIEAQLRMAQAHLDISRANLQRENNSQAMQAQIAQWQYGRNPITQEDLNTNNAPPSMLVNDTTGEPVPYKQNSTFAPTGTSKTMRQMAQTLPPHIQDLRNLYHQAAQEGMVGPLAGRVYQDFLAGRIGTTGDPQADELLGNLNAAHDLVASAMLRTHFGGRGATEIYQNFKNLLPSGASEALLNGSLDQFQSYIKGYSKPTQVTPGNPNGGATPSTIRKYNPITEKLE